MQATVDLARIDRISDGDAEFKRLLIELYIKDTQTRIAHLKQALASHDTLAAGREAHTIKGASGNIGANRMMECARVVEDHCARDPIASTHPAIAAMEASLEETSAILMQHLAQHAGPSPSEPCAE